MLRDRGIQLVIAFCLGGALGGFTARTAGCAYYDIDPGDCGGGATELSTWGRQSITCINGSPRIEERNGKTFALCDCVRELRDGGAE